MTRLPLRCVASLIVLSLVTAAARGQDDVSAALRRTSRALGWERLDEPGSAIEVRGGARFLGTDAEQTLLFDGRGRFTQSLEGVLTQQNGFDGEIAWVVDWTNTPRVLELGDRANSEVSALFLSGAWVVQPSVLAFEVADEQPEDELALDFRHADGVLTGTVHVDRESGLPRTASFGTGDSRSNWTFTDYREHDGFRFPQRIVLAQEGLEQDLVTSAVARLEGVADERFAAQLAAPDDTHFDPALPPGLEVRRVASGHLLVHPLIDGEDLGWFIFDSGAGIHCIAKHVADKLVEGPFGEIRARGIGGSVPAHFWRAERMQLGPVTFDAPLFMELDLAFLEQPFGVAVGGILGFELFARCAVELDMQAAEIALHDSETYALPETGVWQDALLYGRHPCLRATVEERTGLFKIDTGAADDTLTMHYHAVVELDLLAGRETSAGATGGVGGHVATRVGEVASFVLGEHRFEPLEASFTTEDKGAFSDAYVWGNIGGKLLAPFRLVFDYPHRRLGFVPR